jgi:hypothetical protein
MFMHKLVKRPNFEYKRKKGYIKVKSDILPTTLLTHDTISTISHSEVIIYQEANRYTIAVDVEETEENKYSARRMVICQPVETEVEFKAIFSKKIRKVELNTGIAIDMLSNDLVLNDGTKILKNWSVEFKDPKSYEHAERIVKILLRFLEFMKGSYLDVESTVYYTEDSRNIAQIFPKPVFISLSVPRKDEVYQLFDSVPQSGKDKNYRIYEILGAWIHFFLESTQHSFLESMPSIMQPYEYELKNKIISERVDFLVGMYQIVYPNMIYRVDNKKKSAGMLLKDLLQLSTVTTQIEHRRTKNIIEKCKNIRNLVVHKIRDSSAQTEVNKIDYEVFETFFYQGFSYLIIIFWRSSLIESTMSQT